MKESAEKQSCWFLAHFRETDTLQWTFYTFIFLNVSPPAPLVDDDEFSCCVQDVCHCELKLF